jgi:2-polyprenyl-6-methoxyphenol hydroxylase-like FAD-dependent oxidoreductase
MTQRLETTCCIAGGGPAGMMLGFLLARAGVDVLVLEKHGDFLRDFRGDTIHPSTLEVMGELGLLDEFLKLPHEKIEVLSGEIGDTVVEIGDFRHLPTRCKFIAIMPQWDFLNFLARAGKSYPTFSVRMNAAVTDIVVENERVAGVRVATDTGPLEVRAALVVGADGRHSVVREKAGFEIKKLSVPIDVLWFALTRRPDDPFVALGHIEPGRIFVTINRGDHWQCGLVIPKGAIEEVRRAGLAAFREMVARLSHLPPARIEEIKDWDQVKLLTVLVDRLKAWSRPGLLCIGDAAHAMSPIGGVGINLAIQDAVAAANILAAPLRAGRAGPEVLARVQRRRILPTRIIQWIQITLQNRVISRVLQSRAARIAPPFLLRLFQKYPVLRRIPARLVGLGIRPEHARTAESPRHSRQADFR